MRIAKKNKTLTAALNLCVLHLNPSHPAMRGKCRTCGTGMYKILGSAKKKPEGAAPAKAEVAKSEDAKSEDAKSEEE